MSRDRAGGPAAAGADGRSGDRRPSNLDTYKQFAQPSIHAGLRRFSRLAFRGQIHAVRRDLYAPVRLLQRYPVGPLRSLVLIRFVCRWVDLVDRPLRDYLLREVVAYERFKTGKS